METGAPGVEHGRVADSSEFQMLNVDQDAIQRPGRIATGSSVLEEGAIEEYGRTYHHYMPDRYYLPNDGEEQDRLDMQHHIVRMLLDGHLFWAPLENPRNVLDIATGTGLWAIEFARDHPECSVIGSDLSEIQPRNIVPNCEFIREDADGVWTHDRQFDYIHMRYFCSFSADLAEVLRKAYDQLEPGGWIEFQETTYHPILANRSTEDTAFGNVMKYIMKSFVDTNRDPWAMTTLKDALVRAGFVDVVEKIQPLPINDWPVEPKYKEIGKWHLHNVVTALDGGHKFVMKAGKSRADADDLIAWAQDELISREKNFHVLFYVVYGRKPRPEELAYLGRTRKRDRQPAQAAQQQDMNAEIENQQQPEPHQPSTHVEDPSPSEPHQQPAIHTEVPRSTEPIPQSVHMETEQPVLPESIPLPMDMEEPAYQEPTPQPMNIEEPMRPETSQQSMHVKEAKVLEPIQQHVDVDTEQHVQAESIPPSMNMEDAVHLEPSLQHNNTETRVQTELIPLPMDVEDPSHPKPTLQHNDTETQMQPESIPLSMDVEETMHLEPTPQPPVYMEEPGHPEPATQPTDTERHIRPELIPLPMDMEELDEL